MPTKRNDQATKVLYFRPLPLPLPFVAGVRFFRYTNTTPRKMATGRTTLRKLIKPLM
jgi:hypothetical protein